LFNHGDEVLRRLFESGKTINEITSTVVLLGAKIAAARTSAVRHKSFPDRQYFANFIALLHP
jgi:hypothetical protein